MRGSDEPAPINKLKRAAAMAAVTAIFVLGRAASGSDIDLVVSLDTGEVSLLNTGAGTVAISLYKIESASLALDPLQWQPVTGRVDAGGDGSFDPLGNWFVFRDESAELTEGVIFGPGGDLVPDVPLSLGVAWDTNSSPDLTALVVLGEVDSPVDVVYSPVGDYDLDGVVAIEDYLLFRSTFGSTDDSRADGNGNGVVDAGDYTIWRDATAAASLPAPLLAANAPEPSTAAAFFWCLLATPARRR